MGRRTFSVIVLVGLALGWTIHAQTTEPYLEGTAQCSAVSYWFADGYSRGAAKNRSAIEPYLVLFAGSAQDVTVSVHRSAGSPLVQTVNLPAKTRTVVDLFALVGRTDADFSVDVEFAAIGAADLKMWSGGSVVTAAVGLPLCR